MFMLMFTLVLALRSPIFAQQPQPTSDGSELTALRQSLDQVVVLLRELVDQSARRDAASLLLGRIELAERRLAPVEQQLRTLRQQRLAEGNEQLALQSSFQSIDDMEKLDVTGSAKEAFEAERQRVSATLAQKDLAIVEIDRQISALEAAIAERRWAIASLDEAVRALTERSPDEAAAEDALPPLAEPADLGDGDEVEGQGETPHPDAARQMQKRAVVADPSS